MAGARFLTVEVGAQISKERKLEDPCGNGSELDTQACWAHIQLDIDTDNYCQEQRTHRNIYRYVITHGLACTHLPAALSAERDQKEVTPQWQHAHLAPTAWFLIQFSSERKQGSLEKWLILGWGQDINKMSLEHPVVQESAKKKKDVGMAKG